MTDLTNAISSVNKQDENIERTIGVVIDEEEYNEMSETDYIRGAECSPLTTPFGHQSDEGFESDTTSLDSSVPALSDHELQHSVIYSCKPSYGASYWGLVALGYVLVAMLLVRGADLLLGTATFGGVLAAILLCGLLARVPLAYKLYYNRVEVLTLASKFVPWRILFSELSAVGVAPSGFSLEVTTLKGPSIRMAQLQRHGKVAQRAIYLTPADPKSFITQLKRAVDDYTNRTHGQVLVDIPEEYTQQEV